MSSLHTSGWLITLCTAIGWVSLESSWTALGAADAAIEVIDEQGHPVELYQAMWQTGNQAGPWESKSVSVTLPKPESSEAIDLVVRADGYATQFVRFTGENRRELLDGRATITLRRGREVQLQFVLPDNMKFPKMFKPQFYFSEYANRVRATWQLGNAANAVPDFNMLNARSVSDGVYSLRLPSDPCAFHVAIYHPAWLRYFEAGPFTIEDFKDGRLEVPIPRPASIQASLDVGGRDRKQLAFEQVTFDLRWQVPGQRQAVRAAHSETTLAENLFRVTDLAPGAYYLFTGTVPRGSSSRAPMSAFDIDPGRFHDNQPIELNSGESFEVAIRYVPFDADAYRGEGNAVIKLLTPEGEPAAGRRLKVTYYDGHYGMLPVCDVVVPSDGMVRLEHLSQHVPNNSPVDPYTVMVDDRRLGFFRLQPHQLNNFLEYRLIPGVGDLAPEVELVSVKSSDHVRLSEFRGQVIYMELWATWCGPCQAMMEKLNELARAQADRWDERVVLLSLNVDENRELVLPHVERRGWASLNHYWSIRGRQPTFAQVQETYSIFGIPEAVLIGPDGKIIWRGHPGDRDAMDQIDEALTWTRVNDAE